MQRQLLKLAKLNNGSILVHFHSQVTDALYCGQHSADTVTRGIFERDDSLEGGEWKLVSELRIFLGGFSDFEEHLRCFKRI